MKEEIVGLSELKSSILKCGDCGFKLVDIVLIENNDSRLKRGKKPLKSQYKVVVCPKCSGSSFATDILEGTVVIGSVREDYNVEVEETELDDDLVKVTLRVNK